ncbi:HAMP domain-containing sensor histidine kinase [Paenibacillus sp.]|jgi:two-component system sporulation sensor kinase B|uniref:HAMP domain-containing sensor histidine kinase n=1 Tax=Paenibacillus sp. TaxID=58172 RepID=UPI002831E54A|nr:HAMP domain-containing sensor histidine kinase [Paenibacillus sp.]MDR0269938.1 HAMP domain-containing histidine kinase [Paenibacillus sp.]
MIKDLLLDILDVLFPLLSYQFICIANKNYYKQDNHRQILLGLCCGTAIVLSMLLPSNITNDFTGDLRIIPLIISVLYGRYIGGIICFSFFLVCRFYIGMDGFLISIIAVLIICFFTYPFATQFIKRSPQMRFIISIILTMAAIIILWCTFVFTNQTVEISTSITLQIFLLQMITMCMSIVLMEVTISTISMQEQMIFNEKLAVTSQLAASVAHEIRSPLTSIKGFLQLSLRNAEGKHKSYLEISMVELNRMEYIINDFLNYAKPQIEMNEVFTISEILDQIKESIEPIAQSINVGLNVDSEDNLWIQADQFKVKQALINIIKNSIDASTASKGEVTISAYRQLNKVCIKIRDNGVGMTREQLSILGTPFYSTKMNGTGLGLMVTFRIIQAISGKLEFHSVIGEGTTALVMLPAFTEHK